MGTTAAADIEGRAASGDVEAQIALSLRFEREGKSDEAVGWMRRAAVAGDFRAKTILAMRLVSFNPLDVVEGAKWAREAATEGSPDAARVLALLSTEGLGVPPSWPAALDWLERAAILGHRRAWSELAALSGYWRLVGQIAQGRMLGESEIRRLRAAINLATLFAVPLPETMSSAPRIALARGFLSHEVCNWLIELASPSMQRARIVDQRTGIAHEDPGRDNSATSVEVGGGDFILALTRARIAAFTRLPVRGFEVTAILKYEPGQKFGPHHDYLDPEAPGYLDNLRDEGQRVATFLVYLNEGFEGGETAFPMLNARFKGRKGDALIFWNVAADGSPDKRTLHSGLPPTRGEKWLLSQWIRAHSASL